MKPSFNLKVVTHLKSASGAIHDAINRATIKLLVKKALVCIGMVVLNQHERFLKQYGLFYSHTMVK